MLLEETSLKEKTLIIVKPDAFSKRVVGKVISEFEKADLRILGAEMIWMSLEQAEEFYVEHREKEFYKPLVNFMSSNPVIVMVWEGEDAIKRARSFMGATDPRFAREGTIRKRWAQDGRHNIVHGSDSKKSAEREINFFFGDLKGIYKWHEKEYKI